jgi:hypothetical protein
MSGLAPKEVGARRGLVYRTPGEPDHSERDSVCPLLPA